MATQDVRVWTGAEWVSIVGPAGADGANGSPGQKGDQGDTGPEGPEGPAGADGADGQAATIGVGTVTSTAETNPPQVTNVGTSANAVFNFVIPKGEKGDAGSGVTIKGTASSYPPPGPNTIGDMWLLGPGSLAAAPASAEGPAALGDGIVFDGSGWVNVGPIRGPQGDDGAPGLAATVAIGTVTEGPNSQVTNTGTATNAILNFVLQPGADGAPGAPGADGADGADGENAQCFVQSTTPILPRTGAIWIVTN